ncbi:MAG: tetratricopeptide repeat protein [Negativicutes bacterium]
MEPDKGRKVLIGFIIILVVAIASLSFLMLKPAVFATNDLTKANEYLKNRDIKNAETAFSQAILENPKLKSAYVGRAQAYIFAKKFDAAMSDIDTAIGLGVDDDKIHLLRGVAFASKGNHSSAISEYAITLEKNPSFILAHLNIGRSYERLEDFSKAIESCQKYIQLASPDDPNVAKAKKLLTRAETGILLKAVNINKQGSKQPTVPQSNTAITPTEKEMIRGLLPFFSAVNNKDFQSMKNLHLGMRTISESAISTRFSSVNSFTLQGVENVSQNGNLLNGLVLYTADMIVPNSIGKNLAPYMIDAELIKEGNVWVIKSWVQIIGEKGSAGDMKYFNEVFTKMGIAEKRYGVKDLSKWVGLNE